MLASLTNPRFTTWDSQVSKSKAGKICGYWCLWQVGLHPDQGGSGCDPPGCRPPALADLGGGVRDARPPLGVQILSISCSFRENLACSRPPWRVHAPPRENPGSATGLDAAPMMQTPLEADPPPSGFRPLQRQIPLEADPPGHVTCDTCWEATPRPREQNDTQV